MEQTARRRVRTLRQARGPRTSLVGPTNGLQPGRALDAGCGTGADRLWPAPLGWRVTAVDVSPGALELGRQAARGDGPALAERVEWLEADLRVWEPGTRATADALVGALRSGAAYPRRGSSSTGA